MESSMVPEAKMEQSSYGKPVGSRTVSGGRNYRLIGKISNNRTHIIPRIERIKDKFF
jgi:hypothetical protein